MRRVIESLSCGFLVLAHGFRSRRQCKLLTVKRPHWLWSRYPYMSSAEPATSVFVSTSRDHPLHMWDAFTGNLRATYRAYDHLDEVVAANSVCFNTSGDKIFAGKKPPSWFQCLKPLIDGVSINTPRRILQSIPLSLGFDAIFVYLSTNPCFDKFGRHPDKWYKTFYRLSKMFDPSHTRPFSNDRS